jgi:DNA polymerase III delta subunit
MQKIILNEHISMSEDAKNFILNVSNNNAKILINYMEKFKLLNQHIDYDLATNVCTNISFFTFESYTQLLKSGNLTDAVLLLYGIYDKGYSVMDILDNYFLFIKTTSSLSESQKYEIIPLICKYITIFHNIHEDEIELALFSNNLFPLLIHF